MISLLPAGCAVCFGDPASLMSKGVASGVLLLMAVIASVLGVIAWTGISWARRAKKIENGSL